MAHRLGGFLTHALGITLLAGTAFSSVAAISPPRVAPKNASLTEFSAARALDHLPRLAAAPHPPGTVAHDAVRAYLVETLDQLGLAPRIVECSAALRILGGIRSLRARSIVARLRGTRGGGRAVALVAHYDTVSQSPGASDDGSGLLVLLETARALVSRPRLPGDVLFLITDGEEMGALGAQCLLDDREVADSVGIVLNFEARGSGGAVVMYDPSVDSGALVEALGDVPRPFASSFLSALAKVLPNDSDVTIFKRAGLLALGFAHVDGFENYHRATDDQERIEPASVQHGGSYALALTNQLGRRDLETMRGPDVVYFDLFARWLVRYSTTAARVLAALTVGLLGALVFGRRRELSLDRSVRAAASTLLGVMLSAVSVSVSAWILGRWIDGHMAIAHANALAWQAILLGTAISLAWMDRLLRNVSSEDVAMGTCLSLGLLLALAASIAPGLTAPFQWPLLFALLGAAGRLRWRNRPRFADAATYLSLSVGVVMFASVIYCMSIAIGAQMPFAPVLFLALGAGLLAPLVARMALRTRRAVCGGALFASACVGAVACWSAQYGPADPCTDSLVYAIDADRRSAQWFTYDEAVDSWVADRIAPGAERKDLSIFTRSSTLRLAAPAPLIPFSAVELEVLPDDGGGLSAPERAVALRLTSPDGARCIRAWEEGSSITGSTSVDGRPVRDAFRFSPETDETLIRMMTGDDSPRTWRLRHCVLGPDRSVQLRFSAKAGLPIRLRVVQEFEGLPPLGGAARPRPRDAIADEESDVTLVSQAFDL